MPVFFIILLSFSCFVIAILSVVATFFCSFVAKQKETQYKMKVCKCIHMRVVVYMCMCLNQAAKMWKKIKKNTKRNCKNNKKKKKKKKIQNITLMLQKQNKMK